MAISRLRCSRLMPPSPCRAASARARWGSRSFCNPVSGRQALCFRSPARNQRVRMRFAIARLRASSQRAAPSLLSLLTCRPAADGLSGRASRWARWRRRSFGQSPPNAHLKGARSTPRRSAPPPQRPSRAPRRPTMRLPAPGTDAKSSAFICAACCPVRNRTAMSKNALQFLHNGREVAIFVDGGTSLLVTLRELIGDMTPKFGCGQGGCGACSVLIDGELHLSCLTLAETVSGRSIETLDGMKDGPNLHPLQRAFMEQFAAQCGYCTPGMLMAAKALLDRNPSPSRAEVVEAISGNICRCTGYEPIINAVLAAATSGRARA